MEYDIHKPWLTLDPWQKKYIDCIDKNCHVLCGRQSGKSAAASIKFGKIAKEQPNNKKEIILMIAETEKQAYMLFFKTLLYLETVCPKMICKGIKKPTQHKIELTNGSIIMCYAAGLTGSGLRGFTLTRLVVDEAAPMSSEIFASVSPMLSVTGGIMDLISTPRGKEGYFYEQSKNPEFEHFIIRASECPRHSKKFLESEKERMSALEYAQEYDAMFLDELRRLFSDELIKQVCIREREQIDSSNNIYLGVDVAGFGKDECTYEVIEKQGNKLIHRDSIIEKRNYTTDTSNRIIELNRVHRYKQIGIDDGGIGFGVYSELMKEDSTKRKTIPLNNSSRPIDYQGNRSTKILKEEMYFNLLRLMERGDIELLKDSELIVSLKSIQLGEDQKIFGNYSHIVEGLIRAVWLAIQDTRLKVFARTF